MSAVLAAMEGAARSRPDMVALSGDETALSWSELAAEVQGTTASLSALLAGRRPEAPVAMALDNGPAWAVVDLALAALGRPVVPLPPFFTPEQVAHAMHDCGAELLLRPPRDAETSLLRIAGADLAATWTEAELRRLHPGTAKITYTSGSTGRPKGVCLSLAQMEGVAASIVEVLGRDLAGVHMPVLPLGVLLENVAGLYASILAGGRCHAPGLRRLGYADGLRPDPGSLADLVDRHGVTSLILTPALLHALTAWLLAEQRRLETLRFVAVGGARVAPQLIEQARRAGLPAYEGYGLSECASVVALNTPGHDRLGAVGRPLPHVELKVAPDGELAFGRRPFLGYVGGPPCAAPLVSGDLGGLSADGFLSLHGRKSNLIVTAYGRNVSPEWVESELEAEPEVGQAAVFGDGAAALCALVVARGPTVAPDALAAAVARANARLPVYARVARWRRTAAFDASRGELTANGRPRRSVLQATHRQFIDSQTEDVP